MNLFRSPRAWISLALAALGFIPSGRSDDWPNWLGPKKDGVWHETGLLEKFPSGGPKVIWRKPTGPVALEIVAIAHADPRA